MVCAVIDNGENTYTQTTRPRAHSAMSIRTLECFRDAEIHTERGL